MKVKKLSLDYVVLTRMIQSTLHLDLNLTKKSVIWVPKLLTDDMKKERVRMIEAFLAMVSRRSKAMFNNIVTMDELSFHFTLPR